MLRKAFPWMLLVVVTVLIIMLGSQIAGSRELYMGQYAQVDPATRDWYKNQMINSKAKERLGVPWQSCCEHADVFRTEFRVGADRLDEWWYLKGSEWKRIPDDVVHWDEHAPDGRPTLFIYQSTGQELCFYPPFYN